MDQKEKIENVLNAIEIVKFHVAQSLRTFKFYSDDFNDDEALEIAGAIGTTIAVLDSLEEYFKNISDITEQTNKALSKDTKCWVKRSCVE